MWRMLKFMSEMKVTISNFLGIYKLLTTGRSLGEKFGDGKHVLSAAFGLEPMYLFRTRFFR